MTRQVLDLAVKGLYTSPSTFAEIPAGALSVADNIVIDRPNLANTRRGFANFGPPVVAASTLTLFNYNKDKIKHTSAGELLFDADDLGDWTAYPGTFVAPDPFEAGSRIRSFQSNRNCYFLTQLGTYKLDRIDLPPIKAGAPRGLGAEGVTSGATGFFPNNSNVAYRVVWGYIDTNGNLILGAPGDRTIVSNISGTNADVSLTFQIPNEIDTTWFYQVYRSETTVNLTVVPSDNLQLTAQGYPTSGDITSGFVTIIDQTPQTLLQAFLYTNTDQAGILQSNFRPPFAKDACTYRNYAFYANTRTTHSFETTLLSTGATLGLQVNDPLRFTRFSDGANFTVTGKAVENAAAGEFLVSLTGNQEVDIQLTAESIARVINIYASNTFLSAYYISNVGEVPGQLQFQLDELTETGFYMNSTRETCWSPTVLAFPSVTAASSNEVAPNRIYWSRELQPEAVPIGNWLEVGSKSQGIDRIIPLRDGIIVLKQDGVFRLSGNSPEWTLTGINNTVRIIAPNTAAALDNQVFFLSDQGVVAITDNDMTIKSYPIERTILELTSPVTFPNVADLATCITYSSDRKYILCLPLNGTDGFCGQQYCYNTLTDAWTRWTRKMMCGIVNFGDNRLYLGGYGDLEEDSYVVQERKSYTRQDYADEDWAITILSFTTNSITISNADFVPVYVGDTVVQGINSDEIISATEGPTETTLFFANPAVWVLGDASAFNAIDTDATTIQIDVGDAGKQKQFVETSFIFTTADFTEMGANFTTDLNGTSQRQTLRPSQSGGWGQFGWGQAPWGGATGVNQTRIRTMVPSLSTRANWLYIKLKLKQCFTSFGLSGMSIIYNDQSSRQRQGGDK